MTYDVRAIANFVLDLAEERGRPVSNLSINKIVFFLHAYFLAHFNRPLVTAKIEAWKFGPVFRELYREFKVFEDESIRGRAYRIDADTGKKELCSCSLSEDELKFLENLSSKFLGLAASTLVSLSHEAGGPWDQVWNHESAVNATMHISDEIIKDWYAKSARH